MCVPPSRHLVTLEVVVVGCGCWWQENEREQQSRGKLRFFSKPNVHVPAAAVTESRPASGSSATFPMDPAVGTGPIGTAVLDLLSGSRERSRLPTSARYRSFRALPGIVSRTTSCSSAATEKNFKIEELSLATITARKAPPPCMGLPGSRSAHTFGAAPEATARSASAEDKEHDCWRELSRAPARLLLLHARSHAALNRVGAGAKARDVPWSPRWPTAKNGSSVRPDRLASVGPRAPPLGQKIAMVQ